MKCTVCGKQSDVLAEGKCVDCYEKALSGDVPEVSPVQATAVPMQSTLTQAVSTQQPRVNMNLGENTRQLPTAPKRSIGKSIAKYAAFGMIGLIASSGITYYMLFVRGGDESADLQKADISAVTASESRPDAKPAEPAVEAPEAAVPDKATSEEKDPTAPVDEEKAPADPEPTAESEDPATATEKAETTKLADTDGDGIPDFKEVKLGIDPNKEDTDGDRVNDLDELRNHTDPKVADTDGDGVEDDTDPNPLEADEQPDAETSAMQLQGLETTAQGEV